KIKVYDKGITICPNSDSYGEKVHQMMVGYRSGDMWSPKLDMTEALKREQYQFVDCIEQNSRPITDGQAGLRFVRLFKLDDTTALGERSACGFKDA
ncbi:gfo/Idh/MocA family oxidoreductase, partial [Rhizobium ruizarguesonis]